eukprot:06559.XXX_116884_118935_1 [CDS] Oithona nana genome sequencing.
MKTALLLGTCIALLSLSFARQRRAKVANTDSQREGKLFSLFSVVQFKNDPCTSTSSLSSGSTKYRNGTCYTSTECGDKGGSSKGSCAAGFGVCCVFMYNDDDKTDVNYNDTYLQNPDYPSAYSETNSISYTINKVDKDICWLRLDFETFTTVGPSTTLETGGGECVDKLTFTVTSGQQIPELCGTLTGQHMYIEVGNDDSDKVDMNMQFTNSDTTRKWDIKIAQLLCGASYVPPGGCLQYHTDDTGTIYNFNFQDTQGSHLRSQDYSICIRQSAGHCCVQYSVCSDDFINFSFDNTEDYSTATAQTAKVGTSCSDAFVAAQNYGDYISILGSGSTCGDNTGSRYCGAKLSTVDDNKFNVPICDCSSPFMVGVHFDDQVDTASDMAANRGFCLNYRQVPC